MNPGITIFSIIASIVCLAPAAYYLLLPNRDPFHPMIFVGVASFFLIPFKTFTTQDELTMVLDPSDIILFSIILSLSILGYYAGWGLSRFSTKRKGLPAKVARQFDPSKILMWGLIFTVVGTAAYILTFKNYTITGYLQDVPQLWIIGAVMLLQAIVVEPRYRLIGILGLLIGSIHPIYNFIDYGQRGDVIRIGIIAMVPFFAMNKRPPRLLLVAGAAVLAIVLSSLALTRNMVDSGEARNRVDALMQVGPAFFKPTESHLSGAEEWYYGPAAVKTAWASGKFGWGRVFTVALPLRFLPKEFFPWKYDYYYNHVSFDRVEVPAYTGVHIPWGAAPTGFAEGYVEFWWFFPFFWGVLGYIHQRFYARVCVPSDFHTQAICVAFGVALSYLMAQEILFACMNLIYTALPALVGYYFSRVPVQSNRTYPELQPTI